MSRVFLATSAAHVWGAPEGCRAAPMMQAQFPEREVSEASREGTAAHELAAEYISRALRALPSPMEWIGRTASNGVVLTEEMAEACQVYADDVRGEAIHRGVFGGPAVGLEQRMMLPRIHALNGGTPDFWMHDERNRTLLVWDFKFGYNDVEAFENWQLINYAALILDHLGINGAAEQHYKVILKVVQPRSFKRGGPVDTWTVAASDLRPYWNDLAQGAIESTASNPVARPGRRCLNCTARHKCDALKQAAAAAMDFTKNVAVMDLPPQALALELSWLETARDLVEARVTGLQEEAENLIKAGHVVPGWGTETKYSRGRQWKDPQQALNIGQAFGVDLRRNEPITPKQAEKAGLKKDVIEQFSERPAVGTKLVRVKSNEARKVFTK